MRPEADFFCHAFDSFSERDNDNVSVLRWSDLFSLH